MAINEHTGDRLISKKSSKAYDQGWERIFGNKDKPKEETKPELIPVVNTEDNE